MQPETLAPIFGNNTTKAAIIQTLTEKPYTIKELHSKIQKTTSKNITYQALHKAVKEMLTDEILEKQGKQITINKGWVEKLSKLTEQLKEQKVPNNNAPQIRKLEYHDFSEFGKAILCEWAKIPNPQNLTSFCFINHAWPLISMNKDDWARFKKLFNKKEFYGLIKNDTPLDKAFEKPFETLGKRVFSAPFMNIDYDSVIIGDTVTQVYFDSQFRKEHDLLFKRFAQLDENALSALSDQFLIKKTRILALIITDSALANQGRQNAQALIERAKKHKHTNIN